MDNQEDKEKKYNSLTEKIKNNDEKSINSEDKLFFIKYEVEKLGIPLINIEDVIKSEFLAKGTYGSVFKASYKNTDVALKELISKSVFNDLVNFTREISISFNTFHERVPKFHGIYYNKSDSNDDIVCLVFDLVKGENLRKYFSTERQLKEKIEIFIQLVSIIKDLHSKNIVHRDLKPENILINPDGKIYLIDFGTSKMISNKNEEGTYGAKGTVKYMGPENFQLNDDEDEDNDGKGNKDDKEKDDKPLTIGLAFDIWSIGCIISEICSGVSPWENSENKKKLGENSIIGYLSKKNEFPIPEKNISNDLKEILIKCFKVTPDDRISCPELLEELIKYNNSI
jgi:serine/threonine protein kinase